VLALGHFLFELRKSLFLIVLSSHPGRENDPELIAGLISVFEEILELVE